MACAPRAYTCRSIQLPPLKPDHLSQYRAMSARAAAAKLAGRLFLAAQLTTVSVLRSFRQEVGMGMACGGSRPATSWTIALATMTDKARPVALPWRSRQSSRGFGVGPTGRGDQSGRSPDVGTTTPNRSEIPARLADWMTAAGTG